MEDLRALSTEELLDRSRLNAREHRLHHRGTTAALVIGFLTVFGMVVGIDYLQDGRFPSVGGWLFLLLLTVCPGLIFVILIFATLWQQVEQRVLARVQPYLDELTDRHLLAPAQVYMDRATAAMSQADPPDYVLLLTGRGLPHGPGRGIRVVLRVSPEPRATLEVGTAKLDPSSHREMYATYDSASLDDDGAVRLVELLDTVDPATLADVPPDVIDGFPCRVTVLRREPRLETSAECNLSGASAASQATTVHQYASLLCDLAAEVTDRKVNIGACTNDGTIILGDL